MCDRTTDKRLDGSAMDGGALVELARGGSGAAFAALVTLHGEAVYAIARNMSVTPRDAEEVLEETFLSAWHDLGSFPAGTRFATWLYGIAMKTALAHREAQGRRQWGSLEGSMPNFDGAGRLVSTSSRRLEWEGGPSEAIRVAGLLREALECMDDQTRAAFVLRDLVQVPVEDAAEILRTSPQSVRRDAHRACLMLNGFVDGL